MKKLVPHIAALMIALAAGSYLVFAQQPGRGGPPQPMSFFVTSVGKGDGANYGGLAGADAYCQQLGTAAGRGAPVVWHAYMSTQGAGAVNARDRIGNGPWFTSRGGRIGQSVAELHGDTIEQARLGNPLGKQISLTEKQGIVNGVGDMPNTHDILTGSNTDGTLMANATCNDWTSQATNVIAQVGHSNRTGGNRPPSWNSAHATTGCAPSATDNAAGTVTSGGGRGSIYCFAVP